MSEANRIVLFSLIYMLGMVMIGWYAGRKVKDDEDYVVAGRNMPAFLVTATLFATFWGGGTVLGASGAAFNDGLLGTIYDPFAAGLALVLIGLFFTRIFRRMEINSLDTYYYLRYGKTMNVIASILMIPTYIFWSAVQVMAIGKIFSSILGLPYITTAVIGGIVVIVYTVMGGMLAIAWTDFMQGILIVLGLIIMVPLALKHVGGYHTVMSNVPRDFLSFFPENNLSSWLWYIAAWAGMALGNIPAPDIAQRSFIAKDEETARKSAIGAGMMYWIFGLIPIFLGFVGITMVKQGTISADMIQSDSELLIPLIAKVVFSPIPAAIFLGSLLSAVMSSADSSLFASSVILSNLVKLVLDRFSAGDVLKGKKGLLLIRLCIVLVGSLAILVGIIAQSLYDLMIFSFSMLFGMLFAPMVLGIYWKKTNEPGAIVGALGGFFFIVIGAIMQSTLIPGPEWVFTLLPPLVSIILTVVVSLITAELSPARPLTNMKGKIITWKKLEDARI